MLRIRLRKEKKQQYGSHAPLVDEQNADCASAQLNAGFEKEMKLLKGKQCPGLSRLCDWKTSVLQNRQFLLQNFSLKPFFRLINKLTPSYKIQFWPTPSLGKLASECSQDFKLVQGI